MLRRFLACSSPAIAKLWPSRNSIVVRASRLVSDGMLKPEIWTAFAKSSSLTDGARRRLMMPPAKTVGTNVSCYAEGLPLDGDDRHAAGTSRLRDRHREFAARQEGGGVTGECNQVRLGQASDEALRLPVRSE